MTLADVLAPFPRERTWLLPALHAVQLSIEGRALLDSPNLVLVDLRDTEQMKHVFAVPTLNYSSKLPPLFTSVAGVQIVNSAHIVNGTLNVNETVQLAERTLPDLLATANHEERRVYAKV